MSKKSKKKATSSVDAEFEAEMRALEGELDQLTDEESQEMFEQLKATMQGDSAQPEVLLLETIPIRGKSEVEVSVLRERLQSGASAGVDVVTIDNGTIQIAVLPTRGMGVWRVRHTETEQELMWDSPVRWPVHPSLVNLESRNGLGWLDGFNELVSRCGLASNGPPGIDPDARSPIESSLTLHGRIANTPADEVEVVVEPNDDPDAPPQLLGITGRVDECTMFGPQLRMQSTITTPVLSHTVIIEDVVTNTGSTPTELQLLYHINIGEPFLEAGATLHVPASTVVPRDPRAAEGIDEWSTYLGPTPGYAEQAYYFEPKANAAGESVALLKSRTGERGTAVRFEVATLPRFIQWKCTQPKADGYVTGLEPATGFPNFKAYERKQGRVISLGALETYSTRVTLTLLMTAKEVAAVEKEIREIQGTEPPVIHRTPQPGWSPAGEAS